MKTLLRSFIFLAVLIFGASAGYLYAVKMTQAQTHAFDMGEMYFYHSYMTIQMSEGTDSTREEALRHHLALIEKQKTHPSVLFTEKIWATDSALTYARLAAIVRKRGAEQEAQELLGRAASFCDQTGWRECSEEKISSVVQKLDKQGVFSPNSLE